MGKQRREEPKARRCLYCLTPTTGPARLDYVRATEQSVLLPGDPDEPVIVLYDQSRMPHHVRVAMVDDHVVLPLCELVRLGLERKYG